MFGMILYHLALFFFFSAEKSYAEIQAMGEETFLLLLQQRGWQQQTRCKSVPPPKTKKLKKQKIN